jgi:Ca2+-binding EF-hand superfamily protein
LHESDQTLVARPIHSRPRQRRGICRRRRQKNKSASSGASASAKHDFDKADKNHDGKLSRTEFDEMMKASASGGSTSSSKTSAGAKASSKPSTSSTK